MFVIYAIWVVAGLATCVPLVGISMYFLGDAGSNPSWLGASLMLLWALPVAMVTVFVTVLSAGLAVRASWGQSAGAAFEHALGGFFSVVFAIFNGFV